MEQRAARHDGAGTKPVPAQSQRQIQWQSHLGRDNLPVLDHLRNHVAVGRPALDVLAQKVSGRKVRDVVKLTQQPLALRRHTHARTHAHLHAHTHARTHAHLHTRTHARTHARMPFHTAACCSAHSPNGLSASAQNLGVLGCTPGFRVLSWGAGFCPRVLRFYSRAYLPS
eukprot:365315-Chlamydomonas_euryale.AAC.9